MANDAHSYSIKRASKFSTLTSNHRVTVQTIVPEFATYKFMQDIEHFQCVVNKYWPITFQ